VKAFLEESLQKKLIFFTGKGGVGKTFLTWSTAIALSNAGKKAAVVSWDAECPFPELKKDSLQWIGLDTFSAFKEYALKILKFSPIYETLLNNYVIKSFLTAVPGFSETVLAGKVYDLVQQTSSETTILVDLPSSGHAISFFKSPQGVSEIFSKGFVFTEAQSILETFRAPTTALYLVTLPEALVWQETLELENQLREIRAASIGGWLINQCIDEKNIPKSTNLPQALQTYAEKQLKTSAEEKERLQTVKNKMSFLFYSHPWLEPRELFSKLAQEIARGNP